MIKKFSCKLTEEFFLTGNIKTTSGFGSKLALRMLDRIDNAISVKSLDSPLVPLKKREHSYYLRLSDSHVICFDFKDGHAYNVAIKGEDK